MTTATLTAPTLGINEAATTEARTAASGTTAGRRIWRTGATWGAVAAVATTGIAGIAHAAGVSLDVSGEAIPLLGFAQLTFVFSMIGALIAVVLSHRASRPHRTFVVTTLVLTALSLVPDAFADAAASTRLTLALTHVVAAAIVIPKLASRLPALASRRND